MALDPSSQETLGPADAPTRTEMSGKVGRFVVLSKLGSGGMGDVFEAFDAQLDRKVAIKVLRANMSPKSRARVEREARAMGRLAHPNVVTVFDVGEHRGGLFIAMECVKGPTLEEWQRTNGRTYKEIIDAYRQAAEGLAAAHGEGIVHRDFKPQNAMVSSDGRVKVLDFGLATDRQRIKTREGSDSGDPDPSDASLTAEGDVAGTPAYMSPEQYLRREITPATDQFSLCVALWEALYGERPFDGRSLADLAHQVCSGPIRIPRAPAHRPPRWIRDVLQRGLAKSREDRWPSMRELADALGRDPARRRRAWARTVIGAVSVVAATVGVSSWASARDDRCSGGPDEIATAWSAERDAAIDRALDDLDLPFAVPAWAGERPQVQQYADEWEAAYRRNCEATTIRGEQSVATMELRTRCLHRARVELDAALDVLEDPDEQSAVRMHGLLSALPRVEDCDDVAALQEANESLAEQDTVTVELARSTLIRARAELRAARFDQAATLAQDAAAQVESIEGSAVSIDIDQTLGDAHTGAGQYVQAQAAYERALAAALAQDRRKQTHRAALSLLQNLGEKQRKTDEARARYGLLAAQLADDEAGRASAAAVQGTLLHRDADYAEAVSFFERALQLDVRRGAPRDLLAIRHNNLANSLFASEQVQEAESHFVRALELYEQEFGDGHPRTATARNNLANIFIVQERYEEAEREHRRVLEIRRAAFGEGHELVIGSRINLGVALRRQHKYAEAVAEHRRAHQLGQESLGPDAVVMAKNHNALGLALEALGRDQEAITEYRRSVEVLERTLGKDHPHTRAVVENLEVATAGVAE